MDEIKSKIRIKFNGSEQEIINIWDEDKRFKIITKYIKSQKGR